jgi:hypothetical protein
LSGDKEAKKRLETGDETGGRLSKGAVCRGGRGWQMDGRVLTLEGWLKLEPAPGPLGGNDGRSRTGRPELENDQMTTGYPGGVDTAGRYLEPLGWRYGDEEVPLSKVPALWAGWIWRYR